MNSKRKFELVTIQNTIRTNQDIHILIEPVIVNNTRYYIFEISRYNNEHNEYEIDEVFSKALQQSYQDVHGKYIDDIKLSEILINQYGGITYYNALNNAIKYIENEKKR